MTLDVPKGDAGVVHWQEAHAGLVPSPQSCSSDGADFTCLYQNGRASSVTVNAAALKVDFALDGGTPDASLAQNGTSTGEIAVIGDDHSLIFADATHTFRVTRTGTVLWNTPAPARVKSVLGITPVVLPNGPTLVVVTYGTGFLASFDATTGAAYGTVDVTSTFTGKFPTSPPASHGASLYYVGNDTSNVGLLARIDVTAVPRDGGTFYTLGVDTTGFTFTGPSGSSPLYLATGAAPDGGAEPLVLVEAPANAAGVPQLIGVDATKMVQVWSAPLPSKSIVSPVLDPNRDGGVWVVPSGTDADRLLFITPSGAVDTGATVWLPNLGEPSPRVFKGHIYASNPPGDAGTHVIATTGAVGGAIDETIVVDVAGKRATFRAQMNPLPQASYNGALPLVTLDGGRPGIVVTTVGDTQGPTQQGNVLVVGAP
jgi:hypothetical protein